MDPVWFVDCDVPCADSVANLHCVRLFACICAFSVLFSRCTSWSDPWTIGVHTDVAKVCQEHM